MKVGDKVFVFEPERRVYLERGISSGPDYRSKFVEATITGETSRSWLVGFRKYAKASFPPQNVKLDIKGVDEACWDEVNRRHIASALDRAVYAANHEQLLKFAALVGYKEQQ